MKETFDNIDTDGSDSISLSEFTEYFPDVVGYGLHSTRVFKMLDKDVDGSIEFVELLKAHFPHMLPREKAVLLSYVRQRTIDKSLMNDLTSIFEVVAACYDRETGDAIPLEAMFAVFANSIDFFFYTLAFQNKSISFFDRDIKIEDLVVLMFGKHVKRGKKLDELTDIVRPKRMSKRQRDQINELFKRMDADGSTGLSADELRVILVRAGVDSRMTQQIFESQDKNDDGVIDINEFRASMFKYWRT